MYDKVSLISNEWERNRKLG